jgi:hypothetical protein
MLSLREQRVEGSACMLTEGTVKKSCKDFLFPVDDSVVSPAALRSQPLSPATMRSSGKTEFATAAIAIDPTPAPAFSEPFTLPSTFWSFNLMH